MADDKSIVTVARKRFDQVTKVQAKPRAEAIVDMGMIIGGVENHWDADALKARAGRPTLAINKLPKFLRSVTGDQRKTRPSVKVRPVDSKADAIIAKIFEGHIRNIEYVSNAAYSYDSAFKHATSCGFPGYWRILTDYTDDDSFEQDITIQPIRNHFSVYMDHSCVPYQGKEKFGFIVETVSKEDLEAEYKDKDFTQFQDGAAGDDLANWFDDDGIRVAEYFYKEPCTKTILQLQDGSTVELNSKNKSALFETEGVKIFNTKQGPIAVVKERKVQSHKIMWCKICGLDEPLEGPQEWAGKYIPIIPVMPEEFILNGETVWKGLVRDARDTTRLYDYVASANIEAIALSPKSPLMIGKSQIKGNETQWNQAHTTPYPYLIYNDDDNTTRPDRTTPVQQQPGLLATMQQANMDFEDTIGIFRAGLGAPSNEKSGIAIRERKESSDTGTYEYHDNLSRAVQWSYRVLVDLIPKIYDTERGLRLMNPDETESFAEINKTVQGPNGESVLINDITVGKYDIAVTLGPAYATQRQEGQQMLSDVLTAVAPVAPQIVPIILPKLFKMMDSPEAAEIAEELKKIFGQGDDKDNPEAQAAKQQQQAQQAEQAELQQHMASLDIQLKQAEISTKESAAMLNLARAEAAEQGSQMAEYKHMLDEIKFAFSQVQNQQLPPEQAQPQIQPPMIQGEMQ